MCLVYLCRPADPFAGDVGCDADRVVCVHDFLFARYSMDGLEWSVFPSTVPNNRSPQHRRMTLETIHETLFVLRCGIPAS